MATRKPNWGTIAILAIIVFSLVQSGVIPIRKPVEVNIPMAVVPWCDPWPICQSQTHTTTTAASSSLVASGANQAAFGHIADTWQQWTIHYLGGAVSSFRTDQITPVKLDLVAGSEPGWLDIVFPLQLVTKLNSGVGSSNGNTGSWYQENDVVARMSVFVNNVQVGGTSNLNDPLMFTSNDAVGTQKTWTARIIFSGTPSTGQFDSVLNLSGALNGKTSAFVLVGLMETWTTYQVWTSFALFSSYYCASGGTTNIGNVSGKCQIRQTDIWSPGSVNFNWSPGAGQGGATITYATQSVGNCPSSLGGIASVCVSQPSTQYAVTTKSLTITIAANATTQVIGPALTNNTNATNLFGGTSGACKVFDYVIPDWFCGVTFGIPNLYIVLIGVAILLIIWGLRRGSGSSLTVNVVQ